MHIHWKCSYLALWGEVKYSWLADHFFIEFKLEVDIDMCRLGDGVCLGDGELLEFVTDGEGEGMGDAELELCPPSLWREPDEG